MYGRFSLRMALLEKPQCNVTLQDLFRMINSSVLSIDTHYRIYGLRVLKFKIPSSHKPRSFTTNDFNFAKKKGLKSRDIHTESLHTSI